MADWYISSVAYAAVAQWAATHAYTVGNIIRPLTAPAVGRSYCFRCTTAGTSVSAEPNWTSSAPDNNNSFTESGGTVVWQNVTGQSAYNWSAPAGTLYTFTAYVTSTRVAVGDRVFISSDHNESMASMNFAWNGGNSAFGLIQIISVNRAGAIPPGAADIQNGAALTCSSGNITFDADTNTFWQGFVFTLSSTGNFYINPGQWKTNYFKNCAIVITGTGTSQRIATNGNCGVLVLDNTTVAFGNASQGFGGYGGAGWQITWINTPSAIQGATLPSVLFIGQGFGSGTALGVYTCRGVDLSAITGTLANNDGTKALFDSCRIASGVARIGASSGNASTLDEIELVNCFDGTNVLNERYTQAGTITTDRTTYLTSGAQDDIGNYSLKLVSSARSDFAVMPLDCFAFDIENTLTGASHTATVQIISSSTLNNTDIRLLLEYMGTSGSPIATMVDSLASVLTTSAALPSSSATWNSPPSTPQAQLLQVTFTPQRSGRIRGIVRLGKVSATVWVDPRIIVT